VKQGCYDRNSIVSRCIFMGTSSTGHFMFHFLLIACCDSTFQHDD